jgi:hypothetical protein
MKDSHNPTFDCSQCEGRARLFQIPRTTRVAFSHANLFAPRSDLLEIFCNCGELLQGGLKIIRDLLGDDARRGQIG